jgi:hypothetical protein
MVTSVLNPIGHVELRITAHVRHEPLFDGQLDFISVADIGCEVLWSWSSNGVIDNPLTGRPRPAFDVESFPALDPRLDGHLEIYLCSFASRSF